MSVVSRPTELEAVTALLTSAAAEVAALVIEGEAGIGKTSLWLDALDHARVRNFRVLSARGSEAESVLAYAALADMLGGLEADLIPRLPRPQRDALYRVLLQADGDDASIDHRVVAAGFLSVVTALSEEGPVLIAVDDLQWLDSSSAQAIAFALRRLSGPVGVLCTLRSDPTADRQITTVLQTPRPEMLQRIVIGPLSVGALHAVIKQRLGFSLSRPLMVRVHDASGGNPFYALEVARCMSGQPPGTSIRLPGSLSEIVRARVGQLPSDLHDLLLATACLAAPTVDVVARATGHEPGDVAKLLAGVEQSGVVGFEGNRLRFIHPLLARGVYTDAPAGRRRAMHARLAEIVEQPELAARHMALAATHADPRTLKTLDAAAKIADKRGAPAAAAELIELAIGLGGDTPRRRMLLAQHYLNAGDSRHARNLLEKTIDRLDAGPLRAEASNLLGFVHIFGDSFAEAASVLEQALPEAADLTLRTEMLVTLAYARYNAGRFGAATRDIDAAVAGAERLGQSRLLGQALGLRVILGYLRGDGLDEVRLNRALELDDFQPGVPMAFHPRMQNAMITAWNGDLERASRDLAAIRRHCIERGLENELTFVAIHSVLVEIWRGDFVAAAELCGDTTERANQLGGDVPLFVASTIRASLAAFAGQEDLARRETYEALAASHRCGANLLVVWTLTTLGFLEVSLGNHAAALDALCPLLARLKQAPSATEITFASFVPDAVEALVGLGRLDEADELATNLWRNGIRLDRAWMLAVGARCRAMVYAARGDLDAALSAAEDAMREHARLAMPFEKARTQMLVGQILRRHRRRDAAARELGLALEAFDAMGIPLWANRTRAEIARIRIGRDAGANLTPGERRVAQLAAAGLRNRDIASELFISPKTVEVNMTRIYRKLGIRSRAELGKHMAD